MREGGIVSITDDAVKVLKTDDESILYPALSFRAPKYNSYSASPVIFAKCKCTLLLFSTSG